MEAAEIVPGAFRVLDSDRKVTRLGASVFRTGRISPSAMEDTLQVLAAMGKRYRELKVDAVRAVGTSALRDASNSAEFLKRAAAVLGTDVEVVSGLEEARLIYLGVQARWPYPKGRLLTVDVGGGSAEVIVGENGHLVEASSKKIGAVRLQEVFLKSDPPARLELEQMSEYIDQRLDSVVRRLRARKYDRVVATSATAAALVCAVNKIRRQARDQADRRHVSLADTSRFYDRIAARNLEARRKVTGIGPRRAEIIIPGTAVLLHLMRALGIQRLYYSAAGLRDGAIADLAARNARPSRLDPERRQVVTSTARRYQVDMKHARKVAQFAGELFAATRPLHGMPPQYGGLLEAAAYLYDIGHFVSDTRHHRHSYYLVAHSDLPGFTERERNIIANLCRYHRKAMPAAAHSDFHTLDAEGRNAVLRLTPLLRLSAAIDQTHEQRVRTVDCIVQNGAVTVVLHSNADAELEKWAAEQVAGAFRQVYNRELTIGRANS